MKDLRMKTYGRWPRMGYAVTTAMVAAVAVASMQACGGGDTGGTGGEKTTSGTTSDTGGTGTGGKNTGGTGTGGTTTMSTSTSSTTSSTGTGGSAPLGCTVAATGPTRGSAIAITPNDKRIVAVNRDVGTVSVIDVDYASGQPVMTKVNEITVGGEPWQVAINGCGDKAYVVLRKDQQVVEINGVSGTTPTKGKTVNVGSEPTGLALTPNNKKLYVSNWVDGTLSVIDPITMTVTGTVDLNPVIAADGGLGQNVTARAALAHPRSVAITNNGDADDDDETVYAPEWFAVRTGPEDATGTKSDANWKGLLYKVAVSGGAPSAIDLPPVVDTGFVDAVGKNTGCFPNQVGTVSIDGGFAYVTSTCASPVGPTGVFQRGTCAATAQCTGAFGAASVCTGGVCTLSCTSDAQCGPLAAAGDCVLPAGQCKPTVDNAKTTTHPAVSIVNLGAATATTTVLDKLFETKSKTNAFGLRVPLLPTDMDFRPGFGYVSAQGADAVFRLVINNGTISDVGSASNNFIDVRTPTNGTIRLPVGVATAHNSGFAFAANDGTRDVTAIDLGVQEVSNKNTTPSVVQASALPAAMSPQETVLKGKRFFTTGLGRWSLRGQAWGSCAACHIDGLSDNVTWYFARGPRQTVSLDGSFDSTGNDQRVFNWTGIFDEVSDFEGNTRGISGGVGAIVTTAGGEPCTVATQVNDCVSDSCNPTTLKCNIGAGDRINTGTTTPPQQGLQGSSDEVANPMGGNAAQPHSAINDWHEVTEWVKTIRSPRKPTNLVAVDVAAGKALFNGAGQGKCDGCHSGPKWTISKRFYTPGDNVNAATASANAQSLSNITWNLGGMLTAKTGFPANLFPTTVTANQKMRAGAAPAFEQIVCVLRPVGTILPPPGGTTVPQGVSDAEVNVLELRQDMVTGGQGSGALTNEPAAGFNPPSLLGMSVGAPYYHAGNARTLEEVFSTQFAKHHQALAQAFAPNAAQVKQLVAFILSIDENEAPLTVPALGANGGVICSTSDSPP